jgi:hypothetical protein
MLEDKIKKNKTSNSSQYGLTYQTYNSIHVTEMIP